MEHQALKVLTFGMIYVNRVVCGLGQPVEDPDPSTGPCRSLENGLTEIFGRNGLRTGECEENGVFGHFPHGLKIEVGITLECILDRIPVFCKCWRVKDHKVVVITHVFEVSV